MKLFGVTTTYNEEKLVPYVMKYAETMGYDKLIVYDNESTDNTVELLKQYPFVEVRTYHTDCFCEMSKIQVKADTIFELKNACEGEEAWCTQCDFDEVFFLIPGMVTFKEYLEFLTMNGLNVCTETMFMCLAREPKYNPEVFLHEQIEKIAYQCPQTFNKPNLFRLDNLCQIFVFPGSHQCGFNYGDTPLREFHNTRALCTFHLKFALGKEYILNKTREINQRTFKRFENSENGDVCAVSKVEEYFENYWKYGLSPLEYFKNKILNGDDSYEHTWAAYSM